MIRFDFNPQKFANVVAYIAQHKKPVTKKELCKLIFFADQAHLLQYGRTITGDYYCALAQGPIPSCGLDMLNGKSHTPKANLDIMNGVGRLQGYRFVPLKGADLKVFSRSDLKILNAVLAKFGGMNADQLEQLSHDELAWKKTKQSKTMDFDLFFEGHPEASLMRETVNAEHSDS